MRFKFRLARVLDFLHLRETLKKTEVAALVRELTAQQERKLALELDLRTLLEEGPKRFAEGMQWALFQTSRISADRRELETLNRKILETEDALLEKRAELSRLSMRRQAMENLKDKKHQEFKLEQGRRDQKQMDELYRNFGEKD